VSSSAVKTFEELKLWNDMIFVDVPQLDGGCADGAERPRGGDRTDGAPPKDWDG
jgi:hypothetical protein